MSSLDESTDSKIKRTVINFKNADLRGTFFEGTKVANGVDWSGAKFNSWTRHPASKDEALQKGMVYRE